MKPSDYKSVGQVVQVIGPVVDVRFEEEKLPAIYNAIRLSSEGLHHLPHAFVVTGFMSSS